MRQDHSIFKCSKNVVALDILENPFQVPKAQLVFSLRNCVVLVSVTLTVLNESIREWGVPRSLKISIVIIRLSPYKRERW